MKVTIEVLTDDFRRLLDATSGDANLRHVPLEQLLAEATKRGITGWEEYAKRTSHPAEGPPLDGTLDPVSLLVVTIRMLVEGWEARDLQAPPPDFRHVVNAYRKLREAGFR